MNFIAMDARLETIYAVGSHDDGCDDGEEAMSLSDFPVLNEAKGDEVSGSDEVGESVEVEDFEFRTFGSGGSGKGVLSSNLPESFNMCVADEVFFQGQILPLRPSFSSSRSESMDYRLCSSFSVIGSSTSVSRSSSISISRSHSSYSSTSTDTAESRHSISCNFYSHPSPKPHLSNRTKAVPRTKRTSKSNSPAIAAGWGLLRFGLVKTPEIDLRSTRHGSTTKASISHGGGSIGSSRRHDDESRSEKNEVSCSTDSTGVRSGRSQKKPSGLMARFMRKFSCKCSPYLSVEPFSASSSSSRSSSVSSITAVSGRRSEESRGHSTRTFQWLADL